MITLSIRNWIIQTTVFLLLVGPSAAQDNPQLQVGDIAPALSVDIISNAPPEASLTPEFLQGKTIVVEFWGTWCGGCIISMPHFNALYEEFSDQGVLFLAVTYEPIEQVVKFTSRRPILPWIGHDLDRSMINAWGIREWPTAFVVRDGKILERAYTPDLTVDRMNQLMNQELHQDRIKTQPITKEPMATDDTLLSLRIQRKVSGDTLRSVIAKIWSVRTFQVQGPEWLDTEQYDVLIQGTESAELSTQIRSMIGSALGISVSHSQGEVSSYRIEVAKDGVKLPEGIGEHAGWAIDTNSEGQPIIAGSSMTIENLTTGLSYVLNVPIRDTTQNDQKYFVDLTIDSDIHRTRQLLPLETGLQLVPETTTIPLVSIQRLNPTQE